MARSPHGRPAGVSAFQAIRRSRHSSSANLMCSFFRDFTLGFLRAFRQIYGVSQYWSQISYMAMMKDTGRGRPYFGNWKEFVGNEFFKP